VNLHDTPTGTGLVCPECEEPARRVPPTGYLPAWGTRPDASHTDGSPLCPVIGAHGYQSADPVPAGTPAPTGTAPAAVRTADAGQP
jgi:hypothetical protein